MYLGISEGRWITHRQAPACATPPSILSPAAVRYLLKEGLDKKTVAAGIISLAVKGHVIINADGGFQSSSDQYALVRKARNVDRSPLTDDESALLDNLFQGTDGTLNLASENRPILEEAVNLLHGQLSETYASLLQSGRSRRYASGMWVSLFALFLFVIPVLLGWAYAVSIACLMALALAYIDIAAYNMLIVPSLKRKAVLIEIEGYRRYLRSVIASKTPVAAADAPAIFERHLPYAAALDLETAWCQRFATVLSHAQQTLPLPHADDYYLPWYTGNTFNFRCPSEFATVIGASLGVAIYSTFLLPIDSVGGRWGSWGADCGGGGGYSGGGGSSSAGGGGGGSSSGGGGW